MNEMWPWLSSEGEYVLGRAKSWKNRRKQKACRGRGSQGASRAAPGKSGLHERGKGERVIVLESWEGLICIVIWQKPTQNCKAVFTN